MRIWNSQIKGISLLYQLRQAEGLRLAEKFSRKASSIRLTFLPRKKRPFSPLNMEWNIQNGSQLVLLCFNVCFVCFSACFVFTFDTRFVFTIVFYTKHSHIQPVLFKFETPLSSLSRVLPHWPTGGHFSGWDWWRKGELFFFFFFSFWLSSFEKFHRVD